MEDFEKFCEDVYNCAFRNSHFREMSPRGLCVVFDVADKNFHEKGLRIEQKGKDFAKELSDGADIYRDNDGTPIPNNDPIIFLRKLYDYAKQTNRDIQHFKNLCYYFFMGLGNLFPIEDGYKKLPKKDLKNNTYTWARVSNAVALDVRLTDYFDEFDSNNLKTTEADNALFLLNLRKYKAGQIKIDGKYYKKD